MTWLVWRQARAELLLVALLTAALALFLVPTGLDKLAEFRDTGLEACVEARRPCPDLRDQFAGSYNRLNAVVGWFNVLPALVGVLLAAPIVFEFEQRTFRLAWTQSVPRGRWFAAKVGIAVLAALAFSVALTLLMTWWHAPLDRSATVGGKDLGPSFSFEGVMPFASTMFALALALAIGVISRRIIVATAGALAGFILVRVVLETLFRAGLTSDVSFEAPAGQLAATEAPRDMERFWTVQALEGGSLLVAAIALIALTSWLVRRRA